MESPLVEHRDKEHKDQEVRFEMMVVKFPRSALMRQATEAHMIELNQGNNVLNRRGEWGQNLPPKLVLEDSNETKSGKRLNLKPQEE